MVRIEEIASKDFSSTALETCAWSKLLQMCTRMPRTLLFMIFPHQKHYSVILLIITTIIVVNV